ncbi:hypothetical protein TEA_028597 [Camellia sinensis var. sinensis]|uniref:Inosine/uridine-preferring nucleoside hydrolase domain-containing protein n=1 Tax=Camellia sinensis var. sinensis TaxID=542762 RepID=A0A4S4ESF5_CAMSN|nr:hypothetical protein TEA_028597 [Camellia sinensis var. sinensis]
MESSLIYTDDSVAIFMAFQTPQLEVLGLTTIFGNVTTEDATCNALILGEIAGYPDVPVAEGSPEPLKGGTPDVAYFIHGSDGLGNTNLPPPKSKKIEKTASEFLVDMVSEYPGQVSILALGPLTNLALAVKKDSSFASKVKRVVILGGSFFALGNVNPAAEANIYGDPEAADIVFTSGANIVITGINITRQVIMTDADLDELRLSQGRHVQLISKMCKFYRDWHVASDGVHDFVHGANGLGNTNLPPPKSKKIEKTASEFLVDMVSEYPGEVSILALGPLTNLAKAVKRDSSFASKVKKVVILGGSFFALGNVNPAAEANIYGDPEAADVVFTSGANIVITGINITRQVIMTDADLDELRQSEGRHAQLLSTMCKCYRDWHVESLGVYGIFLHDPVSFVALVRPDLFTYKKGVVRVGTEGIYMGHTLLDHEQKYI